MTLKAKGSLYGIIAAVSYGTNPLGALYLFKAGLNVDSVLFYRYALAAVMLGMMMRIKKIPFGISYKELGIIGGLGVLFATSSITLFSSFHYMDAGIASTLLFVYPIMVVVIMAIFFHERITLSAVLSIALALSGIALLYKGGDGATLNGTGVLLVMLSSLTYALYIVIVNRSGIVMSSIKLSFFVLLFCIVSIIVHSTFSENCRLQPLTTPYMWFFALILALFPTVISLVTMTLAVHAIGSTPTAVLGALEPVTAVAIGIMVFGESFTLRLACGIVLILAAVILIVAGKSLRPVHLTHFIAKTISLRRNQREKEC